MIIGGCFVYLLVFRDICYFNVCLVLLLIMLLSRCSLGWLLDAVVV